MQRGVRPKYRRFLPHYNRLPSDDERLGQKSATEIGDRTLQ